MEDRIPIPTDNIYKFYALFGLLLFIFSAGSLLYVERSTNELVFQSVIDLETLKQIADPSLVDTAKKQVLEKRLQIANSDKWTFFIASGILSAISGCLMYFGFSKWQREVQPIQDEIARLQLEKLRREVDQMKHTIPVHDPPNAGHGKKEGRHGIHPGIG